MEQEQDQVTQEVLPELPTENQEEVAPTKSVKTFWERLDEVFQQNADFSEKFNELLERFPSEARAAGPYRSWVFQPERVCLSSNEDITPSTPIASIDLAAGGVLPSQTFSSFRVRLNRSLVNVKSLQLLSCVIPNAIQNIPDDQVIFFYYKIRSVALANQGAWNAGTAYLAGDFVTFNFNTYVCMQANTGIQPFGVHLGEIWNPVTLPGDTTRPNYYDLNSDHLELVYLPPTYITDPEEYLPVTWSGVNRTFQDYPDLVAALNTAAQFFASIPNDVAFVYNPQLNKIQFSPDPAAFDAGYYYMPAGYEDPNLPIVAQELQIPYGQGIYTQGYSLNLRLGFTWNGLFPNPFTYADIWATNVFPDIVYKFLRRADPIYAAGLQWEEDIVTFNNYPDLVNTSCVRIYTDVSLGSTEEGQQQNQTTAREGILSIVPVNTTNLGVGFYQNTFNNPLTKVPRIITELGFRLVTDQGTPFLLPNSATVLLELGITYH